MYIQYHLERQSLALKDNVWKLVGTYDTRRHAELAKDRLVSFTTAYRILEVLPGMVTPTIDMRPPALKASHQEQCAQAIMDKLNSGAITETQANKAVDDLNRS